MRIFRAFNKAAVVAMALVLALAARADEGVVQARAIQAKYKEAVVTVQLVVKITWSMGGNSNQNESKMEATGTVIGPDGLTVLALSSTDPSSISKAMGSQMKMDAELSDIKILLADNSEIPAEVVIRDVDLDLAFVRPLRRPEKPLPFVDLNENSDVELLDRVVTLNRLGRVANRVYSASFEYIDAVVEKPRRYYIPGNDPTSTSAGCPSFSLDGKLVGIFVLRAISAEAGSGGRRDSVMPIILPAVDILDGVEQVPPFKEE
jgi:hypothetical protein